MRDDIDYLAHERKDHKPTSFNGYLKELIVAVRHVRQGIPATEVQSHLPHLYVLEANLHKLDAEIGIAPKPYVQEIWEAIKNEPQPDKSKSFAVCKLGVKGNEELTILPIGLTFPFPVLAEEWIKESGTQGIKYTILEIIEAERPNNDLPLG